jgi:hypothetical protein
MRIRPFALLALPALSGCSVWFLSGESWIDRSRPVVLVETTGGVEFGAATEFGILTLGRSATEGPCRVRYFLGPTPMIEDGVLEGTGGVFTRADIDLKTQASRALDRSPMPTDTLLAMWTPDGVEATSVAVRLARGTDVEGDVLEHPGTDLPPGATVLLRTADGDLQFAGLIAGKATVGAADGPREYYVFAGVDRIREMLAVPTPHPVDYQPKYRPDDISVLKPVKVVLPEPEPAPKTPGTPPRAGTDRPKDRP